MPPPENSSIDNGARLSGRDICNYMENFAKTFLIGKAKFRMETEVLNIERDEKGKWKITVEDLRHGSYSILVFSRIILSTGVRRLISDIPLFADYSFQGCSAPQVPPCLSQAAADKVNFRGLVVHSSNFASRLDEILATARCTPEDSNETILVVGGGKSAQE